MENEKKTGDKYSKLAGNTLIFAISSFSSKLLTLIVQPFLTYAMAEISDLGLSKILSQYANLLIPFVSMGMSNAIIRFGLDKGNSEKQVFTNGLLTILGSFGIVFIAVILALFSFSTFLGVLYYARGNVAYLCGDNWWSQTAYKLLALAMLLVGGTQAYTVVWDLGDVGIGLMTIFNMLALYPLSGEALTALREYEAKKKLK